MSGVFEFGPFRFDGGARVLWRDGEIVPVPPKALDLLAALLASTGDVVSKSELLRRAWPDAVVEEANLSVNVSILRKALGNATVGRPWIETVARRGYRFSGAVRAAGKAPRSLAVLPFRSLAPSADDDAIGLAMADALITRLAGTGGLEVRPTSAIQRFALQPADPRAAARTLGVDCVLEGRLQRDGDRLRVTVQLLPVGGDSPLWADRFDEPATDLFAVQDAVAERLARALAVELSAGSGGGGRRRTRSVEAYEANARGRWFWIHFSRTWLEKAVAAFHEAAALDPRYAPPHAGLADACLAAGFAGMLSPRDAWDAASAEADQALGLDDLLPEAHLSRAWVRLFRDWDWAGAGAGFARASELDPASASASVLQWRGLFEAMRGQSEAAQRCLAEARSRDPLSLVGSAIEGFRRSLAGDHTGALDLQRRTVELDPHHFVGHWSLGVALSNLGRHEEALAAHRRALELAEDAPLMRPVLARSLALAGHEDEARALLGRREEGVHISAYQEATALLALGDRAQAIGRLEAACEARDPFAVLLPLDPMLRPLHGDPAFEKLAARVTG